jgi:hypothetical protein
LLLLLFQLENLWGVVPMGLSINLQTNVIGFVNEHGLKRNWMLMVLPERKNDVIIIFKWNNTAFEKCRPPRHRRHYRRPRPRPRPVTLFQIILVRKWEVTDMSG